MMTVCFGCINGTVTLWTKCIWIEVPYSFTTATSVTPVEMLASWLRTTMGCSRHCVHISLWYIELGAIVSSYLVGIAVVVSPLRWLWFWVVIVAWHRYQVKSGVTAAVYFAIVDSETKSLVHKIELTIHSWLEIIDRLFGKVDTWSSFHSDWILRHYYIWMWGACWDYIDCLVLTINLNLHSSVIQTHWVSQY